MIIFTILGVIVAIYFFGVMLSLVYFRKTDNPIKNALQWPITLLGLFLLRQ